MAEITTVTKDGTLKLPKSAQRAWKGAKVYIDVTGNTAFITRLARSFVSLSDMADEFKKAARATKLTRKDVANIVREARQKDAL